MGWVGTEKLWFYGKKRQLVLPGVGGCGEALVLPSNKTASTTWDGYLKLRRCSVIDSLSQASLSLIFVHMFNFRLVFYNIM